MNSSSNYTLFSYENILKSRYSNQKKNLNKKNAVFINLKIKKIKLKLI